jgi:hypothetical protein
MAHLLFLTALSFGLISASFSEYCAHKSHNPHPKDVKETKKMSWWDAFVEATHYPLTTKNERTGELLLGS